MKERNQLHRLLKQPLDLLKKSKAFFIGCGLLSTVWVLWRVITKPSRANYPCVRAAIPGASIFITYISSLFISIFSYKTAGKYSRQARYGIAGLLMVIAIVSGFIAFQINQEPVYANISQSYIANSPMGEPQGVLPGRVVWFHDPDATHANWGIGSANVNAENVEAMVKTSILKLTGTSSIDQAWDSLFIYFNKEHGKGAVSYQENEHIFIKCNFVTAFDQHGNASPGWTTPQVLMAVIGQLVNEMSIPQENIAFGDPMVCVVDGYYNMLHAKFPDIKYIDHQGGNGRTYAEKGSQLDIFYSDRGEILRDSGDDWANSPDTGGPVYSDTLYKIIEDADYLINIAALKGHGRAGVTLCAKNHFGSHIRTTAAQLHMGLPKPGKEVTRYGYGQYRIQVDLMGHRLLGGNTVLFMVDGLWGASGVGARPDKINMPPFNNDWTSSIFMSQDQVALESVCLDFLQAMYPDGKPQIEGVDDYLRQAADTTQWPENFVYDPENDGTPLTGMGVHEHWNNSIDKQYSKELGTGDGIDFVKLTKDDLTSVKERSNLALNENGFTLHQNYPNPFNPSTTIHYNLKETVKVSLKIFNLQGQEVETLVSGVQNSGSHKIVWRPNGLPGGVYVYQLQAGQLSETRKLALQK